MNPYFKKEEHLFRPTNEPLSRVSCMPRERFSAIDPAGGKVFLRFKPNHKNDIETIFDSLDAGLEMYLKPDLYNDRILLNNESDRVYADVYPEVLLGALQKLGRYVEDVRFLMLQEQSSCTDEVIIQNGLLYVYRHHLDDDFIETRLYYFENIAYRYKDEMLKQWLASEYFALGKTELKYGSLEEAVKYHKKAAAKKVRNFEIYYESAMLLLTKTNEYKQSIKYFTNALGVLRINKIFLHRALASCKAGEPTNAKKDILLYLRYLERHETSALIPAGDLFVNAGYNTEANILFNAAREAGLIIPDKHDDK